ncbi:hypothetical protein [Methylobacterium sp. WSM2598]|uniref:hypothetical protein n=1 Tax=Methylobacterium sp. WSM2598 TaxID=398261 RepID=UPI00036C7523|nr:hypothetical protein [Methylobacterium sp. WSM2598]
MSLASRRGFLRGLTRLPLIGGGVTLIGNPTAAAEPVTPALLNAYNEWLFYERRLLCIEAYGSPDAEHVVPCAGAAEFHFSTGGMDWRSLPQPSGRAVVVLSAVRCDWRSASGE